MPFEEALTNRVIGSDDFVYLDPPYPPLNSTSFFRHYTTDRFTLDDHRRVAEFASVLRDRDCTVMISNADTPAVRSLYQSWHITEIPATRVVAAYGKRYKVSELIVTSYPTRRSCDED